MGTTLKKLFEGIEVVEYTGSLDRTVSRLATDSRRVASKCLFFALPGARTDGSFFIEEAIDRDAAAIVTEQARRAHPQVTFIRVKDARLAMAAVARRFFDYPDRALDLFGVTGSYGKTTTVHMLRHLLGEDGAAGMTGSIQYDLGARSVPSFRTTPESPDLAEFLAAMKKAGLKRAVVEVDELGIRQKSVHGFEIDTAVFLNRVDELAEEPEEDGFEHFSCLFDGKAGNVPGRAVINHDDPRGKTLADALPGGVSVVRFGLGAGADVRATDIELGRLGSELRLEWPGGGAKVFLPMPGAHNARHFLAAAAACRAAGRDMDEVAASAASFPGVPGRMEAIDRGQPFNVYVDHAHTEPALRNALVETRRLAGCRRLLVVFGCGGGKRERFVRAQMTKTVQELADFAWATSDNPRGEAVEAIFEDMRGGVEDPAKIAFLVDRKAAIRAALDVAQPGDCVVIAGKGHESFQDLGGTVLPFDDRMVAGECLEQRVDEHA